MNVLTLTHLMIALADLCVLLAAALVTTFTPKTSRLWVLASLVLLGLLVLNLILLGGAVIAW